MPSPVLVLDPPYAAFRDPDGQAPALGAVLVGDMTGRSSGAVEEPMVRRPDGSWLVEGDIPIQDVEDAFDLPALPVEERRGYRTLAGFVIARLGRVPRAGDAVEYAGTRFEVVDMDGRRVDKVLVVPGAADAAAVEG